MTQNRSYEGEETVSIDSKLPDGEDNADISSSSSFIIMGHSVMSRDCDSGYSDPEAVDCNTSNSSNGCDSGGGSGGGGGGNGGGNGGGGGDVEGGGGGLGCVTGGKYELTVIYPDLHRSISAPNTPLSYKREYLTIPEDNEQTLHRSLCVSGYYSSCVSLVSKLLYCLYFITYSATSLLRLP